MVTSIMIVGVGGQGSLLASKLLGRAAILEAARYVQFLKPGGQIVTNSQQIDPMPVIAGTAEYPSELIAKMEAAGAKVDAIDALTIAEQAGSSKATNIVLMGVFSKYISEISKEEWVKAVEASVPAKFLELNMKAFEMGLAAE